MDIQYFGYFVTIVDCGCNLSAAAREIHISQSALSKAVLAFEAQQQTPLFLRRRGRLQGLTPAGEAVYTACRSISKSYAHMQQQVRRLAGSAARQVKVGIPPLVLSVLFADVIAGCRAALPQTDLLLVEAGSEELRQMLQRREIDYAVLLAPTGPGSEAIGEETLFISELLAIMAPQHPLAQKATLSWQDLEGRQLAVFNESFSIHRLLAQRFRSEGVQPVLAVKSASWDFLLDSVRSPHLLTILPAPILQHARPTGLRALPFQNPVQWQVVFTWNQDTAETPAQAAFHQYILRQFEPNGTSPLP